MAAVLVDTGPVCYAKAGTLVWCPARTWSLDVSTVLSIITLETGVDAAAASEALRDSLEQAAPPGTCIRIIEHRPPGMYAEVQQRDATGRRARLRPVAADTLRELLGPSLDATTPTGPADGGTYPSRLTERGCAWS